MATRKTWSLTEAALIGITGTLTFGVLLYFLSSLIKLYGYSWGVSRVEALEPATLIAKVGAGFVLVGVSKSIAKKQGLGEFWEAIEWNSSESKFLPPMLYGGCLALGVSLVLTARYGTAGSLRNPSDLALYVVSVVLIGAFVEETYFRGVLFSALAGKFGTLVAVVIVTFISSLAHLGRMFYLFPVMAALGLLRVKSKSVASCFVLHASYNLFAGLYLVFVR